jgi:uncharacterized ion transporter superfamily protein YfcC
MRKFPNALVIMIGFIIISSLLTYIIPHGEYERITNKETNQITVVPGSYKVIDDEPLSVFQTIMASPRGIIERADLIVLILLIGGCFFVIERTGALEEGVIYLTEKLKGKEEIALILVSIMFAAGGALIGLQEEIIAMTPVLLYFTARIGFNPFVAVSISYGSAVIGASFSPINPFAVVIAQNLAELPFLSGSVFRLLILTVVFIFYMYLIIRYANRNKIPKLIDTEVTKESISKRSVIILFLLVITFIILIYGMLKLNWGFNEMTAEFFVLGIIVGLIGKLGINGTSEAYIEGFKTMIFAAMILGLANSISLILKQGMIIDTIIYGLFAPMQYLPKSFAAISMMVSQALLHFPVPSYSGQAILTMPILLPLSDLIGLSRQVCVLAYQYGAVMMDMLVPTNGALMAIIAIAGISFNKWFKFAFKLTLFILGLGALAIIIAIYIGF